MIYHHGTGQQHKEQDLHVLPNNSLGPTSQTALDQLEHDRNFSYIYKEL